MKIIINGYDMFISLLGKLLISFAFLLITIISSDYLYAACPGRAMSSGSVNFGTVTVTSAAVGSQIGSRSVSIGSSPNILSISGTMYYKLTRFTTLSSLGNNIYDTNVPGIGIKISMGGMVFPDSIYYSGQGFIQPATYTITLYKTAENVQSGQITAGQVATAGCESTVYNSIILNTVDIVSAACTVDTTSINVPLGNIYSSIFGSVGSTSNETAFTIPLTCPSAGTTVRMQLDGSTEGGSTTALALSNSGSSGVASGYGIQVLTGTTPVTIGTAIQVATTTAGTVNIPLKARYIKTSTNSTSGTANSTATFTMTYQ
ncbi:TPA: hypothetical protein JLP55_004850 [Escherichia coli]|nr:hypothetical protein [Escherichia coli]